MIKGKDADEAKKLRVECEELREKVQELQRDNSAQQAKMLMSAFGNVSGGGSSGGLSSLMGSSSLLAASDDQSSNERTT